MASKEDKLVKVLKDDYKKIVDWTNDMESDFHKMCEGNKAAGKRVRKDMMDIKKTAGTIRKNSIELKNL
jgi:hypothetical protein